MAEETPASRLGEIAPMVDPDVDLWQRIEALYIRAQEAEPAERDAIMRQLQIDAPNIYREVRAMLDASDAPGLLTGFSFPPAALRTEANERDPFLGQRIGPYRIESVIARGGMGVVYRAEQTSPRRIVALKLIRRPHASPRLLRRFQMEVEVLSRLHHPHIAQVYDAGLHDAGEGGTPYFAMEYLPEARPITDYADEHDLDVEARLRLFLKVCQAVHHGHQRGVIHRDLKPANILVDAEGVPKVIDFGVARSTDTDITITTIETDVGQLIGTIQYMSPEQVEGDPHEIDTRSDVYSLGVVLYELLAGEPPYRVSGTSIFLASQMIRAAEPKPLTRIDRPLPRDLDAIVHRALAKDRDQRYQSAEALCRDLERFLDGQPVEARRPGSWRRTFYWLGRHPILTTCAAWLILIGGIAIGLTWQNANQRSVYVDPDENYVAVRDGNGNDLGSWKAPPRTHGVIPGHRSNGHGRVLYVRDGTLSRYGGAALLYKLNGSFEEPWRLFRLSEEQIPPHLVNGEVVHPDEFGVVTMTHADVFSDLPGDELIIIWTRSMGPALLEVRDLEGEVHYQIWHDGVFQRIDWDSRKGTIVAAGLDTELSIGNWTGEPDEKYASHPRIFAVMHPERGVLHRDKIRNRPDAPGVEITGYFWLQPMKDGADRFLRPVPLQRWNDDDVLAKVAIEYFRDRHGGEVDFENFNVGQLLDINGAGEIVARPEFSLRFGQMLRDPTLRDRIFPIDHFWFSTTPVPDASDRPTPPADEPRMPE